MAITILKFLLIIHLCYRAIDRSMELSSQLSQIAF